MRLIACFIGMIFFYFLGKADSKLAAWVSLHNVFCLLQSQQWNEAKELSERVNNTVSLIVVIYILKGLAKAVQNYNLTTC